MLKTLIKRGGQREAAMPEKANRWVRWSANYNDRIDWGSVVLEAMSRCPETCTTREFQQELINVNNEKGEWVNSKMAGKLYASMRQKDLYGKKIPTVLEMVARLYHAGLMVWLNYTPEEYNIIETYIDHSRDFEMAHFMLHQTRKKYSLQNRVTGEEYETAQFTYMRMALALAEGEPKSTRLQMVKDFYDEFSFQRLNAPTPNYVNLGTRLRGYASCCLYTAGDQESSLAIGDHIAYRMTAMSAGIGGLINTRSLNDPVRGGQIRHQGKLPYYASKAKATKANMQAGRGGAATSYYTAYDPEAETIMMLQNPRSTDSKKNRDIHFAISYNKFIGKKAQFADPEKRKVFQFTSWSAPKLWEKMYSSDQAGFEAEYARLEADDSFKMVYFDARDLLIKAGCQRFEVGTHYEFYADEANTHTPFKETIHSSNLCVAPETMILTDQGQVPIISRAGRTTNVWNGEEYSPVLVQQTGQGQKLLHVYTNSGFELECTPYHKWYIFDGYGKPYKEVRTEELKPGDKLCKLKTPVINGYVHLDKAYINGFYTGDGCLTKQGQRIYLYDEKLALAEHFPGGGQWFDGGVEMRAYKHYTDLMPKFFVPGAEYSIQSRLQWLAGWLDADGCVQRNGDNQSIVAASIDRDFLRQVQLMLQTLGIQSKVTLAMSEGIRQLPANDGTGELKDFWCKTSWRLLITSNGLLDLIDLGFAPNRLKISRTVPQRDASQFVQVEAVVDEGRYDDTYCFTEPKRHMGVFNGLLTGQCTEIMEPTAPYYEMPDLYSIEDHGRGEVALCSLAGVVVCNINEDDDEQYYKTCYMALKMIDKCIHLSDYAFPHIALTAKSRMNAGVGIVGLATQMARKNVKYSSQEGRDEIHRAAERHAYFLIKASLQIAKERGNAPWIHKTKWPEGWLPIDTYNKNVDELVTVELQYDWEELRSQIIAQGGIGHSCLIAHMPTESSSKSSGVPNSFYPVRQLQMLKTDGSNSVDWVATDSDIIGANYELAYEIGFREHIYNYAIVQKFTDQGISADEYTDRRVSPWVSKKEILERALLKMKYGLKSSYYQNSLVNSKQAKEESADQPVPELETAGADERGCGSGGCTL